MTSYNALNHSETNLRKELMKIRSVAFGLGGYQNCQLGLSLNFESKGSGVSAFVTGGWDYESIKVDKYSTKWTESDRSGSMVEMCKVISKILKAAKVDDVSKLKDKPVEIVFGQNLLVSWRILEEVL